MAERRRFEISDVSGGMNPDQHPLYIEENEAADLLNFRIDRVGNLVSRKGQRQYGVEAPSGEHILGLGRWVGVNRRSDYRTLVVLSDGTMRVVDRSPNASNIGDVVFSNLDDEAEGMFLEVEDLVLYANGVDDIVAYDGTSAVSLNIDPPASVGTSTSGSGGLTGDYKYAASYVSTTRGMESPATEASAVVSVADEDVTLTVPVSSHPWVDEVNLYRTTDGGSTFMYLGTIPNDGTPFVDDGSESLSPLVTPILDDIVPGEDTGVRAENIAYHKGRLWASIGDELYWSRPYQLNLFPYYTNTQVPFEGNDTITALKAFQDYLIVFGEVNTIMVAGDGGTAGLDIQLVRQDTDIGATSRDAIVEVDNQLVFLSPHSLRVFPGFGEYAPNLTRTICDSTMGCRADASMVYVPEERSIWLSITDKTWAIHLPNQGLTKFNFYMRKPLNRGVQGIGTPVWVKAEHASVAPLDGTYLVEYAGHTDFDEAIEMLFVSRIWAVDTPDLMKYWRRVGLFASTGDDLRLTISCPDTLRTHVTTIAATVSLDNISNWADPNTPVAVASLWDDAVWSAEGLLHYLAPLPAQRLYGRSVQFNAYAKSKAAVEVHVPVSFNYRVSDRFLGR